MGNLCYPSFPGTGRRDLRQDTKPTNAAKIKDECSTLAPPVPEGEDREGWNWGSTKQLGQALELLGASMPRHPTGNYKTDDAALKQITSPEPAVRLARAVLRYREAKKRASRNARLSASTELMSGFAAPFLTNTP